MTKLQKIEINNFRGIKNIELSPSGKNICLVGPNGSGKSAVVDALNFLLTGRIHCLEGEGSRNLTITEHCPHIDKGIDDVSVKGVFSTNGEEIALTRYLKKRSELTSDKELPIQLISLIIAAESGQHFLSRREILNFIISTEGSRADQIESLLNTRDIDKIRIELKGAFDLTEKNVQYIQKQIEEYENNILIFFERLEDIQGLLKEVNKMRLKLNGKEIDKLNPETPFTKGIKIPAIKVIDDPLKLKTTKDLIKNTIEWFDQKFNEFFSWDIDVRKKINELKDDENKIRDLEIYDFLDKGYKLAKDSDECPLCLRKWEKEKFVEQIKKRLKEVKQIQLLKKEIDDIILNLIKSLTEIQIKLRELIRLFKEEKDFKIKVYEDLEENINLLIESYKEDILKNDLHLSKETDEKRRSILKPKEIIKDLDFLLKKSKKLPNLDETQKAWDILNSSFIAFKNMDRKLKELKIEEKLAVKVREIHKQFNSAREEILLSIYDRVSEKADEYYRFLHEDETSFSPEIKPTDRGGATMLVDFYGRGKHPPHALHSEGHQDSMGLCLFLALCNSLNESGLSLIILDDVVTSIDSQHRRNIARLLKEKISDKYQIIITTHDKLWDRHLRSEGVISSNNSFQLSAWTIDEGPYILSENGDWGRIESLLKIGDVNGAAHRLRHTAEWFLREACYQMEAETTFKDRWDFGDFLNSSMSKYRDLLKKAKNARNSWGMSTDKLDKIDKHRKEVYKKINIKIGEINPNIHYNPDE